MYKELKIGRVVALVGLLIQRCCSEEYAIYASVTYERWIATRKSVYEIVYKLWQSDEVKFVGC